MILANCIEFNERRKICVAKQNGKEYSLQNNANHKIRKVKVDNCLFKGIETKKCDYLFSIDETDKKIVFFIELKGGDLIEAIKQISKTSDLLKTTFNNYIKNGRIIGTRNVPELKSIPICRKLIKEFELTNGSVKIVTNKYLEETI